MNGVSTLNRQRTISTRNKTMTNKETEDKVYKTDYSSDFTSFFKTVKADNKADSEAVKAEVKKYTLVNKLRDEDGQASSRNKLWEGF